MYLLRNKNISFRKTHTPYEIPIDVTSEHNAINIPAKIIPPII